MITEEFSCGLPKSDEYSVVGEFSAKLSESLEVWFLLN